MFNQSGKKIKELSKIYFCLFVVIFIVLFSIIIFGVCYFLNSYLGSMVGIEVYILVILISGVILTIVLFMIYVSSLMMYGYGEIIEKTGETSNKLSAIGRLMSVSKTKDSEDIDEEE